MYLFSNEIKIESNLFNLSSKKEDNSNLFRSNIIKHHKSNSISFGKINNIYSPFSYFTNNNNYNNIDNIFLKIMSKIII